MEFRQQTLDNGLEIIAECNPRAYSTAVAFFVTTGARDEADENSGVSHFLEHMAFKGTPTRSAEDVNRELDEMGSHSNAYTSEEQTVYFAAVLPEYLHRAVEVLSDIMRPSLRPDDFETEKKVILEEIAKYEDQPPFGAHEKAMAAHFGGHPLGRSVLGTTQTVGDLTAEAMRSYFERRYGPANLTLAAAGNVDFERLVALAEQYCGGWPAVPSQRDTPAASPRSGLHVLHKEIATQQYAVRIAGGPAAEDDDRFANRVLATIFGDDSGSRLFWTLVDTGRAEYASTSVHEFQGAGILMTCLCCEPDQTEPNLQTIGELERELRLHGVTDAELQQAQSKLCSQAVLQSERAINRLFSVGGNWIQRREYRTVRETVDAYQAVTRQDVAAVLEKFPPDVNTTVAVGPLRELRPPS